MKWIPPLGQEVQKEPHFGPDQQNKMKLNVGLTFVSNP